MRLTYLIGAGASVGAIPVVSNFHNRLKEIVVFLNGKFNYLDNEFSGDLKSIYKPKEALESFIIEIGNIIYNISNKSIDTYAKSLYDTKSVESLKEFYKLKGVIISYFLLEQSINFKNYNTIDSRYIPWVNLITNRNDGIPFIRDEINILNWNYDIQIENCLMDISKNFHDNPFHPLIQVFPRIGRYDLSSINIQNNRITKLNGTAGMHSSFGEIFSYIKSKTNEFNKTFFMNILKAFDNYTHDYGSNRLLFYYSWEENNNSKKALELALKVSELTTDLVIIGYSFPDYNRKIDYQILSSMTNLKRISIQEKSDDAYTSIEFRIKEIRDDILIERIPFTDPFYIPTKYLIKD